MSEFEKNLAFSLGSKELQVIKLAEENRMLREELERLQSDATEQGGVQD